MWKEAVVADYLQLENTNQQHSMFAQQTHTLMFSAAN
jgi:hypothetical protein